jgi:hypothetical protein
VCREDNQNKECNVAVHFKNASNFALDCHQVEAPAIEKDLKLFDPKPKKILYETEAYIYNALNKIIPLKWKFMPDVKATTYFSSKTKPPNNASI